MIEQNPDIDFKAAFGDGEGFTVNREMTPEELASAKPCPGDSAYAKSWGDTSEEQEVAVTLPCMVSEVTEAIEQGCDCKQPGPMMPMIVEMSAADFAALSLDKERLQANLIEASKMSQRALDRAERALIKAEAQVSLGNAGSAEAFIRIHTRWLHFAEVVVP